MRNVLVLVLLAVFSTAASAEYRNITEAEFVECIQDSAAISRLQRSQDKQYETVQDLQRKLSSLDSKLANYDFQYNVAESALRGCRSAGWGSCDQQARTLDHYARLYNMTVDDYNRVGTIEERAVEKYNNGQYRGQRMVESYNRQCSNVSVDRKILDKHCANSSNEFCKGFE